VGSRPEVGKFGQLTSTGSAALDGTFSVVLANGFGVTTGDRYPVMSFISHTGGFSTINGLNSGRFALFRADLLPTTFTLTSATTEADLAVASIAIPAQGVTPGQSVSVSYTVKNAGSVPATGDWDDSVFLSTSPFLDPRAVLLGTVHHTGGVAGPSSYTETFQAVIPALLPRGYYVLVEADSRGLVPDANRDNNRQASSGTLAVSIPTLPLGTPIKATIANDQDLYFRLVLPPAADVTFSATFTTTAEAEMYVRYNNLPDRTIFDQTTVGDDNPNPQLTVSNAQGGDYYVLLHGREGAGGGRSLTLEASNSQFRLTNFDPPASLNHPNENIYVGGTKFTPQTTVSLIAANGAVFSPSSVSFFDSGHVTATFDLSQVPLGSYTVRASDGGQSSVASTLFRVSDALVGSLSSFTIMTPARVRVGAPILASVEVFGARDVFLPVPFVQVDATNIRKGQETEQFVNPTQPEFIPPGGHLSFGYIYNPEPNVSGTISDFNLSLINLLQTIDWDGQKDHMRPSGVPADAWDAVWSNLRPRLGSTVGDFYALIKQDSIALGISTSSVKQLLSIEVRMANDQVPSPIPANALDLYLPAPGFPMAFARSFLGSSIIGRYHLGRLGRGWIDTFDFSASADALTNVVAIHQGTISRFFTRNTNGTYSALPGDPGVLTQVGGILQLREKTGGLTVFRADGSLDYIQDTNNNRITAGYTDGLLTRLTHSNGDVMTLKYNGNGRISQVIDPAMRIATYTYDASGEQLLTVTTPAGTTSFSYTGETSGPRAFALESITSPSGTHRFFDYDSQGRLATQQRDGGAEAISFSYDLASVRVTNAKNQTTNFFYDDRGRIVRTQDALGHQTRIQFDDMDNLVGVARGSGGATTFGYDPQGNATSTGDPLGARQTFLYDPMFNRLTGWTDARGNQMTFGIDTSGNTVSTSYADGSGEQFGYDSRGDLVRTVDRNGRITTFTYDKRGLLLSRQLADSSRTDYSYDAHGNLLSATDAHGTITMEYDAADRLIKITYPRGRSLSYVYGVGGRRIQSVDQSGFTVNYGYDPAGRLTSLTDRNGRPIVTYSYDAAGELVRKDNGNGSYTTYEYDSNHQLLHLINFAPSNIVNSRFDYIYDNLGRRVSMTTLEGTTSYAYDADDRLTSAVFPNGRTLIYAYDAAGNRVGVTNNGVATPYTTNNLNHYTAVGGTSESYDQAGNLISKSGPGTEVSYTYDVLNRLVSVTNSSGTWNYEYDALGNRVAVAHNGQRTEFLVDPVGLGNVVGEYNAVGQLVAHYTHGLSLTARMDAGGNSSYYDSDAIGSTVGLTGTNGAYLNRYTYLPFGEVNTASETVTNIFKYNGGFGVQDDGSGLNYMRARSYDPIQGRFTQPDPIGLVGGTNFYSYAVNNPVSFGDPSGLFPPVDPQGPTEPAPDPLAPTEPGPFGPRGLESPTIPKAPRVPTIPEPPPGGFPELPPSAATGAGTGTTGIAGAAQLSAYSFAVFAAVAYGGAIIAQNISAAYIYSEIGNLPPCLPGIPKFAQTCGVIPVITSVPSGHAQTAQVASQDPNFISGPGGFGVNNIITGDRTMPYIINFENMPNATAPAQQVVITETLDTNLDLASFQLGDFGFGNVAAHVPAGRQVYDTRIDTRTSLGVFVDVHAELNGQVVTWTFTSIDPATLAQPMDPGIGFLPPDHTPPQGDGYVLYSVRPRTGLARGTTINAQAGVVFDTNAAIATNVFVNTLDIGGPTSRVSALPPVETTTSFTVSWSGSDEGGPGIASYDIYVSKDGGAFAPFLVGTTTTSARFQGDVGHTYGFFSAATDNLGIRETIRNSADTTTQLKLPTVAGDVNGDGKVDCADLAIVKASFGLRSGQPGFDSRADVNKDGVVDVRDFSFVAQRLAAGTRCP